MLDEDHVWKIRQIVSARRPFREFLRSYIAAGHGGAEVVRALVSLTRMWIREGTIAADDCWDGLQAAEEGKLDAIWEEVLRRTAEINAITDEHDRRSLPRDLRLFLRPPSDEPSKVAPAFPRRRRRK